jgi:hypothetical protein
MTKPSDDKHIAWQGNYSGKDIIIENRNLSSVYKTFEPSTSSTHYYRPSVTGLDADKASVVWHDSSALKIRVASYDPSGTGWSSSVFGSGGYNVTTSVKNPHGGSLAKVMWTAGTASPYTMVLSLPSLSKPLEKYGDPEQTGEPLALDHSRELVIRNVNGDEFIALNIARSSVYLASQDTQRVEFIPVADTANYSIEEILSFLESEPFSVLPDANTLETAVTLTGSNTVRLLGDAEMTVEITDAVTGEVVSALRTFALGDLANGDPVVDTVMADLAALRGRALKLKARFDGIRFGSRTLTGAVIERSTERSGQELLEKIPVRTPERLLLAQNYPNPFNPSTVIRFEIPKDNMVTVRIYDILGREVRTVVNEFLKAGAHEARFDAHGLATGIYFYRVEVGGSSIVRKMLLLK